MALVVIQSEPDVDLLHVLEIEATDGGDVLVTEYIDDAAGQQTQAMLWPAERIEAIAIALLAAAREARLYQSAVVVALRTGTREAMQ